VRDLENIRDEAAALPDLVPSRDLWTGIEARIAAPVIPLAARPERQKRPVPAWMGIAAAALIVSTAGVTYLLTARSFRSGGDARIGVVTPSSQPLATGATSTDETTPAPESGGAGVPQSTPEQPDRARLAQRSTGTSRSGVPATLASQSRPGPAQSDAVYGKEIEMLQNIVKQRQPQLDSSTVAVIQKNLEIIDTAIAQSRAALAKDPASRMLNQQLAHALDKKVELLRTAAMLPVSI
jgi:hypothetical protein